MASTPPPTLIAARRFGYGPAGAPPQTPDSMLAGLSGPDAMARRYPVPDVHAALAAEQTLIAQRKLNKAGGADHGGMRQAAAELLRIDRAAEVAAFARIADSQTPFRERLVWFWANHFSVSAKNGTMRGLPGAFVDEAIRPHVAGPFATLLRAAITHPAMLYYLDQANSIGPQSRAGKRMRKHAGINENLAREVMELHTLGVGAGYTQKDVIQFADLLTGLTVQRPKGTVFRPAFAEPGQEMLLGRRYGGGRPGPAPIHAALDDLAHRPETARHLARKLAVHFVADAPPDDLVAALAETCTQTGGDLTRVYARLLDHPAAQSGQFTKLRQPLDFIGAGIRALGIPGSSIARMNPAAFKRGFHYPLTLMGQPFQRPEGPNGWPEDSASWLTPQGLAQRISWSMQVPQHLDLPMPDPVGFATRALGQPSPEVLRAVTWSETREQAVGLVMASPDFNRR